MQGLGQALMENIVYDPSSGQLLTASFQDYAMPAVMNAINDALTSAGAGEIEVPATPLRVWETLRAAGD